MARKIPPPMPPDGTKPPENGAAANNETRRNDDQQGGEEGPLHRSASESTGARQRRASGQRLGAIPRPSPEEVRRTRRRMDSLHLDGPRDARDGRHTPATYSWWPGLYSPRPDTNEIQLEGQELYLHFFHEQLRSAGLGEEAVEEEARLDEYHYSEAHIAQNGQRRNRTMSMNLENFQNPLWRQTGRELQVLADAFAHSHERRLVRQRAEQVDITNLNQEKFFSLLQNLFQGGNVTRERILVLFFFCSDVAILTIQRHCQGLLRQLTKWAILFIRDKVCSWVYEHGGWSVVLHSGINVVRQVAVIGMCATVILCGIVIIRKNLK